jgi:hypothetical protein
MATGTVSLYQAKRDFTKTAEPSGKVHVKPAEYPRFVIQSMRPPGCRQLGDRAHASRP